jgi:hypothetical protein
MADQQALHAFAQWVASCSGNEKQEGQAFVQKLLTAWGWEDDTEAAGTSKLTITKGTYHRFTYRSSAGGGRGIICISSNRSGYAAGFAKKWTKSCGLQRRTKTV